MARSLRSSGRIMVSLRFIATLALALLAAGCHNHVFSPPARTLPPEGVATLGQGRIGLAVEGGRHGEMMGVSTSTGSARFRAGLADQVDLSVENHVMHIEGASAGDTHPNIYAVRLGAKVQPANVLAFTAGTGTGASEGGLSTSPDLGFIVGYPNPYAAPFFAARALMSIPLAPRTVDVTPAGEPASSQTGEPKVTGGLGSVLGLRVPIPPGLEEVDGVGGSLLAGLGNTWLRDAEDEALIWGWSIGGEITF